MLSLPLFAALALAGAAALSDARTGQIPNGITLPPLVIAPCFYLVTNGLSGAALSLASALASALVPYLMFRKGAAGGGDVKLMAGIGAVAGASFGIETQLFGFGLAALLALCLLAYRGKLLRVLGNSLRIFINPFLPRKVRRITAHEELSTIRMGVPFFVAACLCTWLRVGGLAS